MWTMRVTNYGRWSIAKKNGDALADRLRLGSGEHLRIEGGSMSDYGHLCPFNDECASHDRCPMCPVQEAIDDEDEGRGEYE